jgi:hypothetical protein
VIDSYVERPEVQVLRVLADMKGGGPAEAMQKLEAKLSSIRGRKFYGVYRPRPEGEEYFACVERVPGDDPTAMGLEEARVPGGLFVRRKIFDWSKVVAEGKLPAASKDMAQHYDVDHSRPEIEYYRSVTELHVLIPVRSREPLPREWKGA